MYSLCVSILSMSISYSLHVYNLMHVYSITLGLSFVYLQFVKLFSQVSYARVSTISQFSVVINCC